MPPRPPWPCTRGLGQARGRRPPPPIPPPLAADVFLRPISTVARLPLGPAADAGSIRCTAVDHAGFAVPCVGDAPAAISASPSRGAPPRTCPHRRPSSRCPPWPSPALPCSLPCVPRGGRRASIDPCCSSFFSFSRPNCFLGPAQQAQPRSSHGLLVAQPGAVHAQRAAAAHLRPALFFFAEPFFFFC